MRLPGWLDAHETPDTADAAMITSFYSGFYAELVIRELAYWDKATIPEEVFWHIVRVIADKVAPAFGDAAPVEIDIENGTQVSMGKKGWNGLKRVKQVEPSGLAVQAVYF
jgi:hypothetical protein